MYKDNKLLDLKKSISEQTEKINPLLLNSLLRKYQKASNQKENYKIGYKFLTEKSNLYYPSKYNAKDDFQQLPIGQE